MTNAAGAGFVELGAGAMIGMIGVIREKKRVRGGSLFGLGCLITLINAVIARVYEGCDV